MAFHGSFHPPTKIASMAGNVRPSVPFQVIRAAMENYARSRKSLSTMLALLGPGPNI
jgi:hypothetical protein